MHRANSTQPNLFDLAEPEAEKKGPADHIVEVEWSYSRRSLLEQCPRRYYYTYYGANKRAAKSEPDKDALRRLKRMSNRHTRPGDIMHRVIATYFRKAQAGELWEQDRLVSWARKMLQEDIRYSQADPEGLTPEKGGFPPVLLHEFHYEWLDAVALYREAEDRLISALTTFHRAFAYERLRQVGCRPSTSVEKKVRIPGMACRAEGKIDLHFLEGSALEIVDWKIASASADADDSLQLSAYGLWAHREHNLAADAIGVFKAFLGSGDLIAYAITDKEITAARARILQDAERMAVAHEYAELCGAAAFTGCAQPKVCMMCPYLAVCPEGKECVNA